MVERMKLVKRSNDLQIEEARWKGTIFIAVQDLERQVFFYTRHKTEICLYESRIMASLSLPMAENEGESDQYRYRLPRVILTRQEFDKVVGIINHLLSSSHSSSEVINPPFDIRNSRLVLYFALQGLLKILKGGYNSGPHFPFYLPITHVS